MMKSPVPTVLKRVGALSLLQLALPFNAALAFAETKPIAVDNPWILLPLP